MTPTFSICVNVSRKRKSESMKVKGHKIEFSTLCLFKISHCLLTENLLYCLTKKASKENKCGHNEYGD